MKQSSGLDALLEALRQSGMNMDGGFGGSGGSTSAGSSDSSEGSGRAGGGSHRGGFGFGGFGGQGAGGAENPFKDMKMPQLSKRAVVVLVIVVLLVLAAAYWWFHPPINVHSSDTWLFVAIFILLPIFLVLWTKSRNYQTGTDKVDKNEGKAKRFKVLSFIPVAVALVGVVGGILSLSLIPGNAERYANVLQVEDRQYTEDIQEVNYSEIPVIDQASAIRLGSTQLGSIPEYVSQFEISNLYSQINYQGEPVRVSPLGYADLFRWFTNRENGIPAYALVNMTTQEAQIVSLPDGQGIKYSQSEPLARNIDRYVQLKYPFYMFDQKSFEIDEDGHPWWICPVQTRTIGLFGGTTIDRVVLVDAVTGECTDLAIGECPEWIDRAYPSDLLIEQYNWRGAYSNGWLNSWLGQQGVVKTTPGTDGMQGYNYIAQDDDVWVYTGVTSATSDDSIVGFVLINQRTAEAHYYSISGATEERAMLAAEGAVADLGYNASFPLLVNVAGRPTYFMALKDNVDTPQQFAMVDIQSYQNVATGTTVQQCQSNYVQLLSATGVQLEESSVDSSAVRVASGTIVRIAQSVIDGNSHFYVNLDNSDEIFDFELPDLVEIITYDVGDPITFAYVDGDPTCTVQSFGSGTGSDASADEGGASDQASPEDAQIDGRENAEAADDADAAAAAQQTV